MSFLVVLFWTIVGVAIVTVIMAGFLVALLAPEHIRWRTRVAGAAAAILAFAFGMWLILGSLDRDRGVCGEGTTRVIVGSGKVATAYCVPAQPR